MKIFNTSLLYLLCIGVCILSHEKLSAQALDWTFENILTDVQESGANPDLVQDADGNLHVSYWHAAEDRLKYGRRDALTGIWTHEDLDIMDNFHGFASAIALDANGKVHIAYVKRVQSEAQVRYLNNVSGTWQVEIPAPSMFIGKYGRDLEFPVYAQASIDLFFQANGNPVILYFDATVNTIGSCGVIGQTYLDYKLDMNMLIKLNDGSWDPANFDNVPDNKGIGCLLDGDRFGEFCQMFTTSDSRFFALSNSVHNHEILFHSSADLISWNRTPIDSTSRFFNVVNESHFRESFEYIDANLLGDSSIQMVYNVSDHYGNGRVTPIRRPLIYANFHPDSIGQPGYTPFYREIGDAGILYRSHASIANVSEDSVYIAFYDQDNSEIRMGFSFNGGLAWQYEFITDVQTNTALKLLVQGDSLRLLYYNAQEDQLLLSSRALASTGWRTEAATQSELSGNILSSKVERTSNADIKHIAYVEEIEGKMSYTTSNGGTWTFETILEDASGVEDIAMDLDANNSPVLIYADDELDQLRIAWRQGGWNTRVITNPAKGRNINFMLVNGSYHVAYFDLNTGHLHYLNSTALTGPWTLTVVDSSSNIVGRGLDMAMSSNGSIHLSYQDVINPKVRHAVLAPASSWNIEDITPAFNFNPNFTAIAINSMDLPAIAFRDATANQLQLAENDGLGWGISPITAQGGNLIGSPMDLILDDKDRPWVLYNISDIREEMGLLRRDASRQWNQVSITSNSSEIARSFDFHLVEEDFYIIGKKNQLSNNGLGLLFAQGGVKTSIQQLIEETQLLSYPNPAKDYVELEFNNPQNQEFNIELYNLNGQKIHHLHKTSHLLPGTHSLGVALPELTPGMYMLVLRGENYQVPQKLVIMP